MPFSHLPKRFGRSSVNKKMPRPQKQFLSPTDVISISTDTFIRPSHRESQHRHNRIVRFAFARFADGNHAVFYLLVSRLLCQIASLITENLLVTSRIYRFAYILVSYIVRCTSCLSNNSCNSLSCLAVLEFRNAAGITLAAISDSPCTIANSPLSLAPVYQPI